MPTDEPNVPLARSGRVGSEWVLGFLEADVIMPPMSDKAAILWRDFLSALRETIHTAPQREG
jgi:hypothetical protein